MNIAREVAPQIGIAARNVSTTLRHQLRGV